MLFVGSARHDENGKLVNGKNGDQTGQEVSTQSFYIHSKGWNILRPKSINHAVAIASKMVQACNNNNIGYNQNNRLGVVMYGIGSAIKTACDCSSLVRQCVKEATGIDVGNFTTANEKNLLLKSGLFDDLGKYKTGVELFNGDILVTCTKGHTVIVTSGNARTKPLSYPLTTFIKDVQHSIDAEVDGIVGKETISKLVTVSKKINSRHRVVNSLQKYLNTLGYNCGEVDGDFGVKTDTGVRAYQSANKLTVDGIVGINTWKKLLGLT